MGTYHLAGCVGALGLIAACTSSSSEDGSATGTGSGASGIGTQSTGSNAVGSGGSSGTGASGGTGTGAGGGGSSDLPVPPGDANVPKPSGRAANLEVLPWAGFGSAVTYTFDDGQPSHIEHWAELEATGTRMTFYINTWLKDSLADFESTWKDALEKGSEVANHTVHHCNFNQACNGAEAGSAEAELDGVNDYIESTLGQPGVWTFAYPFGDTGYETAVQARFCLARGTGGGMVAPGAGADPFNLPTVAANGGEDASVFQGSIDSARAQGEWANFLFHSILPTGQNWYAGVEIEAITGSIGYAKSLGDVWIDSLVRVGAYWLGQTTIEAARASSSGGETTWTWTLPANFPPGRFVRVTVDGGSLSQQGQALAWDGHGYYEVALDAGTLTLSP